MGAGIPKSQRVLCEINVTPFVDVMLVLLVIFMVTAPMMQQGLSVDLPSAKNTGLRVPDDPFILVIKKSGKIYIGTAEIPLKKLKSKLADIFKVRKSKQIYIHADKKVYYEFVAEAMGEIRSAGLDQINLVTKFKE